MASAVFKLPPASSQNDLKPPPHSIEFEQALLACLVREPERIDRVCEIIRGPEDFYREANANLYRAILAYLKLKQNRLAPIDPFILMEKMEAARMMASEKAEELILDCLSKTATTTDCEEYAFRIREHAVRREAIELANEISRDAYGMNVTGSDLLSKAFGKLEHISSRHDIQDHNFAEAKQWPEIQESEIYQGVVGEIVSKIAPETEADPIAILGQFLVGFGNAVGRGPHWVAERTRHGVNLFVCVCGNSSKARKGTSWDNVRWILSNCDPEWERNQIRTGLSSGEGMVWEIRDPIVKRVKVGGDPKLGGGGYHDQEIDPGVFDKRCLWVESEFGSTLGMMSRDGSSLTGTMRQAWDGHALGQAVKNNPAKATNPHVSIIAHITEFELKQKLSSNDTANGLANRFLWMLAKRSRYLPHGGSFDVRNIQGPMDDVRDAIVHAKEHFKDGVPLLLDQQARQLWEDVYPRLSEPKPGLLGAVTSRAEAQVKRIASIYAILETESYIRINHLRAGLALWQYCEKSAAYIFGNSLGDPEAEKLLEAIRDSGEKGMTATEIHRKVFASRGDKTHHAEKIALLVENGLIVCEKDPKRPTARIWKTVNMSMLRTAAN